ncbi:TIM44-like domain-containing protein [Trinickia sp.]|uniref:Tim44 domain-containing protein n=1 Tax=Trinickia sp. TaxID=2571163 RepID=UPI003F8219DE
MSGSHSDSSKHLSRHLTKRIRLFAVATMVALGTLATLDAEAKRMGGGRSIGRTSQSTMQRDAAPSAQPSTRSAQSGSQAPAAAQAQRSAQPAPAAPSRSRWLGPIAGLAAGLGIAALLSHFGLGAAFASAMANIIIVAVLAMVGIWLVRKLLSRTRRDPGLAYGANAAGGGRVDASPWSANGMRSSASGMATGAGVGSPQSQAAALSLPADFDVDAFLKHAKANFVRLQAANDAGNLADIRAFTTPDMFTELKSEIDARRGESARTDVVQLDGELIGLEDAGAEYFASVRFSGLIRESIDGPAQPFEEIWNLSKSARPGEGWLLAGIEQSASHLH